MQAGRKDATAGKDDMEQKEEKAADLEAGDKPGQEQQQRIKSKEKESKEEKRGKKKSEMETPLSKKRRGGAKMILSWKE